MRLRPQPVVKRPPLGHRKIRQTRLAKAHGEVTPAGNLDGVGERCRQVGKQFHHVGLRTKPHLLAEASGATGIGQQFPFSDANPGLMGRVFIRLDELDGVGGHDRQAEARAKGGGKSHMRLVGGAPNALKLKVKRVGKATGPVQCELGGKLGVSRQQGLTNFALRRPRKGDEPIGRLQPIASDFAPFAPGILQPGSRKQVTQTQIARLIGGDQKQTMGLVAVRLVGNPDIGAENRLNPCGPRSLVELDPAEGVTQIGDRHRRLPVRLCGGNQRVNTHDRINDRVLGMDTQVQKVRISHRPQFYRSSPPIYLACGRLSVIPGAGAQSSVTRSLDSGVLRVVLVNRWGH